MNRATPKADIPARAKAKEKAATQDLAPAQWTQHLIVPTSESVLVSLNRIYESELYDKISRELSFILRHSGWTHADKSLTVFELMAGARFRKMLSLSAHTCFSTVTEPVFPVAQKAQLQKWCEHSVERVNTLLPLAFTIMFNQKGRYQIGILSTSDHNSSLAAPGPGSIQPV